MSEDRSAGMRTDLTVVWGHLKATGILDQSSFRGAVVGCLSVDTLGECGRSQC